MYCIIHTAVFHGVLEKMFEISDFSFTEKNVSGKQEGVYGWAREGLEVGATQNQDRSTI